MNYPSKKDFREWKTSASMWAKIKPLAREHRHKPTLAERRLWSCLRNRQIRNMKFRRQHPIDRFIVDFYCSEAQLVIEVDGDVHQYTVEEDAIRQQFIESCGLRVLRFKNEEVIGSLDGVLDRIAHEIA